MLDNNPEGPWDTQERDTIAGWHGWGAAPQLFDKPEYEADRADLEQRLGADAYRSASRTTLNAHYTDPRIVEAMWETVSGAGVEGGPVLEPGCGSGEVLAAAPEGFSGVGVELDPTTARIAQARLGDAHEVVTANFAEFEVQPGRFAAVVGNVPFGDIQMFDPVHNPDRQLSIHDHFIAKATSGLAPGGLTAVVSSRYTLDARDSAAREAIGAHGDFVGAVRLPTSAHQGHAGTKVVTDVLVFRGRPPGAEPDHAPGFLELPERIGPGVAEPRMSGYYDHHPENLLGEVTSRVGRFSTLEMEVSDPTNEWPTRLTERLEAITGDLEPTTIVVDTTPAVEVEAAHGGGAVPVGHIEATQTGTFRVRAPGGWETHKPPKGQRTELAALCELRDGALELVAAEGDPQGDEATVEALRSDLKAKYTAYVEAHGPLNRTSYNRRGARNPPRMGGFRHDPRWSRVAALEVYDEEANVAAPSTLLERRVLHPPEPVEHVDTPADALAVSLQQTGRLDQGMVAQLLDIEADQVPDTLAGLAFTDPTSGELVPNAEYLSGNVRTKLAAATEAAEGDPERWSANVEALTEALPRPVEAHELTGVCGAPWIPRDTVIAYASERLLGNPEAAVEVQKSAELGSWRVKIPSGLANSLRGDHQFGTDQRHAGKLLEDALNGRQPTISHKNADGQSVVDPEATEAARERVGLIVEDFNHWALADDPERSDELMGIYNEQFNSYVPRDYSGQEMDAPGLRDGFNLRPHQHAAVARMVQGGNTLLAHPVGAGKTAEMIVGSMELRRTGAIATPAFVVPNHMLDQFSRDINDLYPSAEVLAVTKEDLSPKGRAAFAAKVRSHDWDAVVVTHQSFKAWPLSDEVSIGLQQERLERLREDLTNVQGQGENKTMTKQLEKRLANAEEKAKETQARLDEGRDDHELPFDKAGIDYLVVDEAHAYKNAEITSSVGNLRGVPTGPGSDLAADLDDKLSWLRDHRDGQASVTFATGTPISNTVAEMWVMGKYLRPDLGEELGIRSFDAFRAQFCDTSAEMELDTSGTKFRQVERLSKYQQLPELARWWGEFADVVSVEDLGLPTPELNTGARQTVVVEPDPGLEHYMAVEVSARADAIMSGRVEPTEDNMLKLSSDCRMASFDWAGFSDGEVHPDNSTLSQCAIRVADTWGEHQEHTYKTATGAEHPRPGAFQLVFADLGTPKDDNDRTAYDRLKAEIVARGVPADQVQFVHDHDKNDDDKARFFDKCRDGRVSVAISSTSKMGVGTNIQDRMVALHHLDCPWRPSDIEQREGRILRQGNQNPEVDVYAYATEKSFSVYGWQTLERKAGFIGQVMRADPNGPRSIEVADTESMDYGEIKALATGDPRFLQAAKLDSEVKRLDRLSRAHGRDTGSAARRQSHGEERLAEVTGRIDRLEPIASRVEGLDPDRKFQLRIENGRHQTAVENRADAARGLQGHMGRVQPRQVVATFPQEQIRVLWTPNSQREGQFTLADVASGAQLGGYVYVEDREDTQALVGAVTRLQNQIDKLPQTVDGLRSEAAELPDQIEAARQTATREFPHGAELASARTQAADLWADLRADYSDTDQEQPGEAGRDGTTPAAGLGAEPTPPNDTEKAPEGPTESDLAEPAKAPGPMHTPKARMAPLGERPRKSMAEHNAGLAEERAREQDDDRGFDR